MNIVSKERVNEERYAVTFTREYVEDLLKKHALDMLNKDPEFAKASYQGRNSDGDHMMFVTVDLSERVVKKALD